jgi:hypothetical protein
VLQRKTELTESELVALLPVLLLTSLLPPPLLLLLQRPS